MCGISGLFSFSNNALNYIHALDQSLVVMHHRGPDAQAVFHNNSAVLGHVRLSIIDMSAGANQPFSDTTGRYTMVFNGEFYNFKDFYKELSADGVEFRTTSDTEVLLYLYIKYGAACLQYIQGFFAFAVYDSLSESLFVARDRFGVKPLYVYSSNTFFCFASELQSLMQFPFERNINLDALYMYLQLLYVPAPLTMLQNVEKLMPGYYIEVSKLGISKHQYYTLPVYSNISPIIPYEQAQQEFYSVLENAVQSRLVSDVPLGTFLSGGLDSSVVSAIAAKHVTGLQTYSIGFTDNPYFDETSYAQAVARKIESNHTVIPISNSVFSESVSHVLQQFDEPFADSSAIAVYALSKYVKQYVTVALSGDGADELLGGYRKHAAHMRSFVPSISNSVLPYAEPILRMLPQSRNNKITDMFRKAYRYSKALRLSKQDMYWLWCSLQSEHEAQMLLPNYIPSLKYNSAKQLYVQGIHSHSNLNDVLYADQLLVLANDMLTKVDRMSMAHSLEVRSPFLDYRLISYVNSLPDSYKIHGSLQKRILFDSCKHLLPQELYNRPKQGFEVPLHSWCTGNVLQLHIQELLSDKMLNSQGIFSKERVGFLLQKLHSSNPGDSASVIWALLVFQTWYAKYIS
ncbi:MAG TPA: asparagine synthase (glutamine-hydrolyzing) [Bacteroidales bacterium]|nr:asparagine synthase (glutamine-hydrolyzing) [Bacteroidales bacterium]